MFLHLPLGVEGPTVRLAEGVADKEIRMTKNYTRLKAACYMTNVSMSVVANISPVLFLTFRELYGISYSLLGLLVLINFFTQLTVDLIFSFFSRKFDIPLVVRLTPVLTVIGFLIYALSPFVLGESVYRGLALGTVVFSMSGGLSEVLISPVIAAIPAKDPDREMSKLHSVYAWGVVAVIIISTLFIRIFGGEVWQALVLAFAAVPLIASVLFFGCEIPDMQTEGKGSDTGKLVRDKGLWMCVFAIFCGGAAECTMAQWSSGYLEQALGIPKVWGDIFGVAMFSVFLGLGRSLYAKYGRNIGKILFLGGLGAALCYLAAAVSPIPFIGLFACAFTGFCTSMLWPGNLIVSSERFPAGGVFIYAMMAAGGDCGAAVAPQLVGVITDSLMAHPAVQSLAANIGLAPEQLAMKAGILTAMLFPLIGLPVYYRIMKKSK